MRRYLHVVLEVEDYSMEDVISLAETATGQIVDVYFDDPKFITVKTRAGILPPEGEGWVTHFDRETPPSPEDEEWANRLLGKDPP